MGWKYIIIENRMFKFPIIFPDKLVHAEVFGMLRHLEPMSMREQGQGKVFGVPHSAGMIESLYVEGVGGESETLNIKSLGKVDERIINHYKYQHGIKGL